MKRLISMETTLSPKLTSVLIRSWTFIMSKNQSNDLPLTVHFDGDRLSGNHCVAEGFSRYFSSTYTSCRDCATHTDPPVSDLGLMLPVTRGEKTKFCLIYGSSGIASYINKSCLVIFCNDLYILLNKFLANSKFSKLIKKVSITPIFKESNSSDVNDNRPISILSSIPNAFDLVFNSNIYNDIKQRILMFPHGFMRGRFTATNLNNFVQFIYYAFLSQCEVDAIYTDLTKP